MASQGKKRTIVEACTRICSSVSRRLALSRRFALRTLRSSSQEESQRDRQIPMCRSSSEYRCSAAYCSEYAELSSQKASTPKSNRLQVWRSCWRLLFGRSFPNSASRRKNGFQASRNPSGHFESNYYTPEAQLHPR